MPKYRDDPVFFSREFSDDVVDRKLAFNGVGGKGIVFHLIALEMLGDVAFQLLVVLVTDITLAECSHLAGVLEGAFRIDMRERRRSGSVDRGWGSFRRHCIRCR